MATCTKGWEEQPAVVIDNGSHSFKAGLAGQSSPQLFIPSVVARWKEMPESLVTTDAAVEIAYLGCNHYKYLGNAAKKILKDRKGLAYPSFPVTYGQVNSWDDLETVWLQVISEGLGLPCDGQPLLMNTPPGLTTKEWDKLGEILFTSLNVPGACLQSDAVLALLANGKFSGTVVSLGHSTARITPVVEGYQAEHLTKLLDVSMTGQEATTRLMKLLENSPVEYTRKAVDECGISPAFSQALKEKFCYVPLRYNQRLIDTYEKWKVVYEERCRWVKMTFGEPMFKYEKREDLDPCGDYVITGINVKTSKGENKELMISVERCATPECIFDPARRDVAGSFEAEEATPDAFTQGKKIGKKIPVSRDGLAGQIYSVLRSYYGTDEPTNSKAQLDIDESLQQAAKFVLVTGGNTSYKGFTKRLTMDLLDLNDQEQQRLGSDSPNLWPATSKVLQSPDPVNDVFQGGSILGSHPSAQWLTKAEYEESGSRVMQQRFS